MTPQKKKPLAIITSSYCFTLRLLTPNPYLEVANTFVAVPSVLGRQRSEFVVASQRALLIVSSDWRALRERLLSSCARRLDCAHWMQFMIYE